MSQLVVANRKGPAGKGIERFSKWTGANLQQLCLAKYLVYQDGPAHRRVAVFAHHPYARSQGLCCVQQGGASRVEFLNQPRHIATRRPKPLWIVIEMRHIYQG